MSLVKDGYRIACEISVTTTPDQELGNITKCLTAGYDEVLAIASDPKHVTKLRDTILPQIESSDHKRVFFLVPEEVFAHLDERQLTAETQERTVRGYRIKVTQSAIAEENRQSAQRTVANVIADSLRRMKKSE